MNPSNNRYLTILIIAFLFINLIHYHILSICFCINFIKSKIKIDLYLMFKNSNKTNY